MAYRMHTGPCVDCGRETARRRADVDTHRCIDCSLARNADQVRQLHEHRGPAYEHWRRSILEWADSEPRA